MEERDGFRYYQYDWSVVGGKSGIALQSRCSSVRAASDAPWAVISSGDAIVRRFFSDPNLRESRWPDGFHHCIPLFSFRVRNLCQKRGVLHDRTSISVPGWLPLAASFYIQVG